MLNTVVICQTSNQILAGLLRGESQFKPNVMYVEFQTGTQRVDPVPVADPADADYFLRLRENTIGSRDYLRIPVASVTPIVKESPNDITLLFNGLCAGVKGVGGKATDGSIIYGVALASSPTFGLTIDDLTKDIMWARGYYAPENQILFSNSAQTSVTFSINLTHTS